MKKLHKLALISAICLCSQSFAYEEAYELESYEGVLSNDTLSSDNIYEENAGTVQGNVEGEEPQMLSSSAKKGEFEVIPGHLWKEHEWTPGQPERLWEGPRWALKGATRTEGRPIRQEDVDEIQELYQEMKTTPLDVETLKKREQEVSKQIDTLREKLIKESNERIKPWTEIQEAIREGSSKDKEMQQKALQGIERLKEEIKKDTSENEATRQAAIQGLEHLEEEIKKDTSRDEEGRRKAINLIERVKNRSTWRSNNQGPEMNALHIKSDLYRDAIWKKEQEAKEESLELEARERMARDREAKQRGLPPPPGKGTY